MSKVKQAFVAGACTAALAATLGLAGCGSGSSTVALADGTYSGTSSIMDANVDGDGYVTVDLTVADGKITNVAYTAYLPDGTVKDDTYGKDTPSYSLAQKVLEAGDVYADELMQSGSPDAIDVVSGATYLHDQFVEAATEALAHPAE